MKCAICGRRADGRYCQPHSRAYRNLIQGFELWKRAMDIEWLGYLEKVWRNPSTGRWASEVCQDLLSQGGRIKQDVEKI